MKQFILAIAVAVGAVLLIGSSASAQFRQPKPPARSTAKEKAAKLVEEGKELARKKDYDEALDKFDDALIADPKNTEAMVESARIHNTRKDYDEAIFSAEDALVVDMKNSNAWRELGYAHWKLGDDRKAGAAFVLAIKHDPKNWAAYDYLASLFEENGDKRSAQRVKKLKADAQELFGSGRKYE